MADRPKLHDPESPDAGPDPLAGLTTRQRLFVLAYVGEHRGNGYRAALSAGYLGSRNTVEVAAYDLLRIPKIQTAIREYLKPYGITTEAIVAELSDVIRGNYRDLCSRSLAPDGRPQWRLDLDSALENGRGHIIKKVTERKDGGLTVELHDKLRAIELAGRYLHMWGDRLDDLPNAEDIRKMNKEQVQALLSKIG